MANPPSNATEAMKLDDIYNLAREVMMAQGCDADNAAALAKTMMKAECDGSLKMLEI